MVLLGRQIGKNIISKNLHSVTDITLNLTIDQNQKSDYTQTSLPALETHTTNTKRRDEIFRIDFYFPQYEMSRLHNVQHSGFNQTPILAIEEDFDEIAALEWINRNWTLGLWFSAVYVILVFGGKYLMNNKPAFELRSVLAVCSASDAAFSILGTARTLPELLYVVDKYGWKYSVCVIPLTSLVPQNVGDFCTPSPKYLNLAIHCS